MPADNYNFPTSTSSNSICSNNNENRTKKAKVGNRGEDNNNNNDDIIIDNNIYAAVKQYILECPSSTATLDHPAIIGALKGLELEQQRQIRDAKLQRKFALLQQQKQQEKVEEEPVFVSCYEAPAIDTDRNGKINKEKSNNEAKNNNNNNMQLDGNDDNDNFDCDDDDDDDWQNVNRDDNLVINSKSNNNTKDGDHRNLIESESMIGSTNNNNIDGHHPHSISPIGQVLSERIVHDIASNHVTVMTPTGAILVAIHSALVSPTLQFVCTGIPDNTSNLIGFAPPIRDLPKHQFIPINWESNSSLAEGINSTKKNIHNLYLRYRKDGIGSMILTVSIETHLPDDNNKNNNKTPISSFDQSSSMVEVSFVPGSTINNIITTAIESKNILRFPLIEHFNVESWNKAWNSSYNNNNNKTNAGISPTLHYKQLSILLSKFCRQKHLDLGTVYDNNNNCNTVDANGIQKIIAANEQHHQQALPYMDNTIRQLPTRINGTTSTTTISTPLTRTDPLQVPTRCYRPGGTGGGEFGIDNPLMQFHVNNHPGDFAGDLLPRSIRGNGNFMDPLGVINQPSNMGNLLGPNHPMFTNQGRDSNSTGGSTNTFQDPALIGMGGMKARFDPYGPPPTDLNQIDNDGKGGLGIDRLRGPSNYMPNPDHLRPPSFGNNNNNNNMFM